VGWIKECLRLLSSSTILAISGQLLSVNGGCLSPRATFGYWSSLSRNVRNLGFDSSESHSVSRASSSGVVARVSSMSRASEEIERGFGGCACQGIELLLLLLLILILESLVESKTRIP